MRISVFGALLCACLVAATGHAAALAAQSRQLLAMTPQDFEKSASIKDDALEVVATITTEPGFKEKHGLLGLVGNDNFLRAFIDKKSGAASYQLYQRIAYTGGGWKRFKIVNYETPDGPASVSVIELEQVENCALKRITGKCVRDEELAVPINESLLETIAANYAPSSAAGWHFRFKAQTGDDYDDAMTAAEVAGLLASVADYRQQHGLPTRR